MGSDINNQRPIFKDISHCRLDRNRDDNLGRLLLFFWHTLPNTVENIIPNGHMDCNSYSGNVPPLDTDIVLYGLVLI